MNTSELVDRRKFLARTAAGTAAATSCSRVHAAGDEPTYPQASLEMTPSRARLVECLGGDWPEPCPLNPQLEATRLRKGYRIETVSYEVEPEDRVAAMLLIPDGVALKSEGGSGAPAIAVWHQHAGQYHLGKSEPAGLAGNPMHHTGVALVKEGYVVLCPDALCFEDRQDPEGRLKKGDFERFEFLRYVVDGKCMAWKNILDMRRAIDYLVSRMEVDPNRIGCYGHSMGSTHTWLVGPHEPRIRAAVGNCCLPTYSGIHDHKILHCFPNFVPGWNQYGDTPEMAALIAPRALHLNLGELDRGSPIEHAKAGVERIRAAYAKAGAADKFSALIQPETDHVLSPEMWDATKRFFAQQLV